MADIDVTEHLGLVYRMVRKYERTDVDYADLLSAAMLALVQAGRNFDVSRGCAFSTCATVYIRRGLGNVFRKRRVRMSHEGQWPRMEFGGDMDFPVPSGDAVELSGDEADVLMGVLPHDRDRAIVELRRAGYTFDAIANRLNVTRARIQQLSVRAYERMRERLDGHATNQRRRKRQRAGRTAPARTPLPTDTSDADTVAA